MAHDPTGSITRMDDTLVMHGVRDDADAARFAEFNGTFNGADQAATSAALLHHHPTIDRENFVLVEDERTGQVVSTTCLIPWRLQLEGVLLRAAMLEMVVTHPDYRRRGLVRHQIERFHAATAGQGYDLSIIEGIPYYYRQFGYAYALDHWAGDALPTAWIPLGEPDVRLRRATAADIPSLMEFYAHAVAPLSLHTQRDAAAWTYLLQAAGYPTYMVEQMDGGGAAGAAAGYVCGWLRDEHDSISLVESGLRSTAAALSALRLCKPLATTVRLGWPEQGALVQAGRSLGGRPRSGDQWLIRIPDLPRLLRKLAPLWEARLAAAGWDRLTAGLTVNLYRQAYGLCFVDGRLAAVEPLGFVDASMGAHGGDLCLPPDAFTRLLFGYRTLDELRDAWPDMIVQPAARPLIDVLFPKVASYVWLPYMHCGHLQPLPFP